MLAERTMEKCLEPNTQVSTEDGIEMAGEWQMAVSTANGEDQKDAGLALCVALASLTDVKMSEKESTLKHSR